jgi:hypothetical protein
MYYKGPLGNGPTCKIKPRSIKHIIQAREKYWFSLDHVLYYIRPLQESNITLTYHIGLLRYWSKCKVWSVSQAKNIGQGGIVVWTCSTYKTKTDCINITLTHRMFFLDQFFKVSSCQYLILLQQGSFFARRFSCIFCLLNTSY